MVGCGYTYYDDSKRGYSKLYVCNYGPGGNLVGGAMVGSYVSLSQLLTLFPLVPHGLPRDVRLPPARTEAQL